MCIVFPQTSLCFPTPVPSFVWKILTPKMPSCWQTIPWRGELVPIKLTSEMGHHSMPLSQSAIHLSSEQDMSQVTGTWAGRCRGTHFLFLTPAYMGHGGLSPVSRLTSFCMQISSSLHQKQTRNSWDQPHNPIILPLLWAPHSHTEHPKISMDGKSSVLLPWIHATGISLILLILSSHPVFLYSSQ